MFFSIVLAATISLASSASSSCDFSATSQLNRIAADSVGKEFGGIAMMTKLGEWKSPGVVINRRETVDESGNKSVEFEYADFVLKGTIVADAPFMRVDVSVKDGAPELVGPGIVANIDHAKGEKVEWKTGWYLSGNTGYVALWKPKDGGTKTEAVALVVAGGGYPMVDSHGSRHLMVSKREFTYYVGCAKWGREKFANDKEWVNYVDKFCNEHGGINKFHYVERSEKRISEIEEMLTEKPKVIFPPITNREEWDRLAKLPSAEVVIKRVEGMVKDELVNKISPFKEKDFLLYFRNGDRVTYEGPCHRRAGNLQCMVLAECLENRGRFLPKITELIESLLDEPTWVMPAHMVEEKYYYAATENIDLFASMRAYGLAITIKLLEDKLSPELVSRMRSMIRRRVINPYLRLAKEFDPQFYTGALWFFCNYNWNRVCHGQSVGAILLMCDDRRERAEAIEFAERATPHYLSGLRDDGYCVEGLGYWDFGFGHHLLLGLNILEATDGKVNILAGEKSLVCAKYGMAFVLGEHGKAPTFADGGGGAPSPACLKMCTMAWPNEFPRNYAECDVLDYKKHGGSWPILAPVLEFAFGNTGKNAIKGESATIPMRSWFESAKVLICRIPGSEFSAAMKPLCRAEPHGHIDAGTYVIADADGIFAGDVGGEVYTSRTFSGRRWESKVLNSYAHPVPFVDGHRQQDIPWHGGEFVSVDFKDAVDTYVVDLTDAYLEATNLVSLVRTFRFDRVEKTFTVTDSVKFSRPSRFESPIMTITPEKLKGRYEFSAAGGKWEAKEELVENPGRPTPHRISISFTEPVVEAKTTVVFH